MNTQGHAHIYIYIFSIHCCFKNISIIYPQNSLSYYRDTCSYMLITALFTIVMKQA